MKQRSLCSRYWHILICFSTLFSFTESHAGAWTQKSGDLQIINSISAYRSDERFNRSGDKQSQPTYRQWEWNPYAEYGFDQHTTIGASLLLGRASTLGNSDIALAESEWFVRRSLLRYNNFVFSAEPKIKLPGFSNKGTPPIGSAHADAALALQGGYGFIYAGRNHYADVETEYRHRLGNPRDQYRLNATLGLSVYDHLTLMPQAFFTWSANGVGSSGFTQTPRDDYDLTTLQLSALYAFTPAQSLQVGAFKDVGGKNAGAGEGVRLALWSRF